MDLKELELQNDMALIAFWKAVERIADLKSELVAAEMVREFKQREMATARMRYLEAKIAAAKE